MLLLLKIGCVLFDIPAVAVDLLALTGLGGRISSNITCIGDDRGTFQLYDVDTACVCLLSSCGWNHGISVHAADFHISLNRRETGQSDHSRQ